MTRFMCQLLGCKKPAFDGESRCPRHGGPPDPAEVLVRAAVMAGDRTAAEIAQEAAERHPETAHTRKSVYWVKYALKREGAAPPAWPVRPRGTATLVATAETEADLKRVVAALAEFTCAVCSDDLADLAGLSRPRAAMALRLGVRLGTVITGPDSGYYKRVLDDVRK